MSSFQFFVRVARVAAGVLILAGGAQPAFAQSAPSLPGGASSLQERHNDWLVTCGVVSQPAGTQGQAGSNAKSCSLSQQQVDQKSNRRILSVELRPNAAGNVSTLVMPFGLALAQGVRVAVDDAAAGDAVPFTTCLPVGCIVRLPIDGPLLDAMRKGTVLKITATSIGGQAANFSVSLAGFSAAYDRTAELAK